MGTSVAPKASTSMYAPLAYDEPFLFDDDGEGGMSALDMLLQFDGLVVPSALLEPRDGMPGGVHGQGQGQGQDQGQLQGQGFGYGASLPSPMAPSPLPVPDFYAGGSGAVSVAPPPAPPIARAGSSTGGSGRVPVPLTFGMVVGESKDRVV